MRVVILGCGPAGLLAAHAAAQGDHEVRIISKKEKSVMPGAQYAHEPILGLTPTVPDAWLTYRKLGTKEGYAAKVYGDPAAPCSWDSFRDGQRVRAWSMQKLYDQLWERWSDIVENRILMDPVAAMEMVRDADLVISSIHAHALCLLPDVHQFSSAAVVITDQAWRECGENEIVYNGEPESPWYRSSSIMGHDSTEYPSSVLSVGGMAASGYKPVRTNCTCFPRVLRVGRFGQWKKGVLVHHAYRDAVLGIKAQEEWLRS